jgi:hypothetical protein
MSRLAVALSAIAFYIDIKHSEVQAYLRLNHSLLVAGDAVPDGRIALYSARTPVRPLPVIYTALQHSVGRKEDQHPVRHNPRNVHDGQAQVLFVFFGVAAVVTAVECMA